MPTPISPPLLFCLAGLLLFGVSTGCANDKDKIIAEKVTERLEEYTKKRKEECWQGLLAKAEKKVDSLLLAEAQQALQDSLSRLRPFKPLQPPPVPAIDSLSVKPLFDGKPRR